MLCCTRAQAVSLARTWQGQWVGLGGEPAQRHPAHCPRRPVRVPLRAVSTLVQQHLRFLPLRIHGQLIITCYLSLLGWRQCRRLHAASSKMEPPALCCKAEPPELQAPGPPESSAPQPASAPDPGPACPWGPPTHRRPRPPRMLAPPLLQKPCWSRLHAAHREGAAEEGCF